MLALALAALLANSPTPRAAILVHAPDSNDAANLERVVSTRLTGDPNVRLVSATDVAEALGVDEPAPVVDAAAKTTADALWQQSHASFLEANYPAALRTLDELSKLVGRLPTADRVRAHVLSAAVQVKLEDLPAARKDAIAAMVLAGGPPAELGDYPPSVRRVFEESATSLRMVTLSFTRAPSKAEITVDDRIITGSKVSLAAGTHRLRVRAKGFRTIEREIDLTTDQALPLTLAPALDAATIRTLTAVASAGARMSADQRRSLNRLAVHLDVDVLILAVRDASEKRAGIHWAPPRDTYQDLGRFGAAADGDGALAERVAGSLAEAARPVAAVTPPPVVEPRVPRVRKPASWDVRGGLAFSSRNRRVRSADGGGFALAFSGVGPRASIAVERWKLAAELEAGADTFGFSETNVNRPSGGKVAIKGGSAITTRTGVGFVIRGKGAPNATWRVRPMLGFQVEQWGGSDPKDVDGEPMGLNPSAGTYLPSLRLAAWVPVTSEIVVSGSGDLYPTAGMKINLTREDPENTSGDNDARRAGSSGYRASLGAAWSPRAQWWFGLDLAQERRRHEYDSAAVAPFSPPLRDSRESLSITTVTATAEYRF